MDPFASALEETAQLAEFYADADARAWRKDIGRIDAMARRLIAASPLVLVATAGASGRADCSPRGGPAGFVSVLDDEHVALPDATGNRRLDTLTPVGKPPRTAIVVRAEELYTHCPKALIRSELWDPTTWPDPASLPTSAEVTLAHARDASLTLEDVERLQRESLQHRLA